MDKIHNYTLIRSRRKSLALHITKDAVLEARAPLKMPKAEIDRFVLSKARWIQSHIDRLAARADARTCFALDYGSNVVIQGADCPIIAGKGRTVSFDGINVTMPPNLDSAQIKRAVVRLYKLIAKNILNERVGIYSKKMGVAPSGVKITGAMRRWGSCSSKNSLNFTWRLAMADLRVVDYVVVHELAHIIERNHSPRFWAVVEKYLPDYKERRKIQKQLYDRLASEDWNT